MRDLTWDDFADAAGRAYTVEAGDARVELTLDRIEQLQNSPRPAGGFRLEFLGPLEPVLPQAIYPFGADGDSIAIFVVPIAREAGAIRYEAVFF